MIKQMTTTFIFRKVNADSKVQRGVMMGRFHGKRVLITGGTSGIGLAGALRIVKEGGQVAITGLSDERLAQTRTLLPDTALITEK